MLKRKKKKRQQREKPQKRKIGIYMTQKEYYSNHLQRKYWKQNGNQTLREKETNPLTEDIGNRSQINKNLGSEE